MSYAPPEQAALAVKEGPVVRNAVARLAETVEPIMRGITVAETCGPPRRSRFFCTSTCVATSPVPLPATTAMSRRSRRDCASAASAAL